MPNKLSETENSKVVWINSYINDSEKFQPHGVNTCSIFSRFDNKMIDIA